MKVDQEIHAELLSRYKKLNLALYRGFVNPVYTLVKNESGEVLDVEISYDKNYVDQNLKYSKEYSVLPNCN